MTTLLQDIKDQVLQRTGMEFANTSTDPEWLSMINSSLAELYEILISKKDAGYFETELEFEITEGSTQTYPSDFKEMVSLDHLVGSTYHAVRRYTKNERNLSAYTVPTARRYRLTQSAIKFLPEAAATGTYRMFYIPRYTPATALADSIGELELDNWHEYAVVDCAIKFLTKQETDCMVFLDQKQRLLDRITRSAASRDAGEPYRLNGGSDLDDYMNDGAPRRF